MDCWNINQIRVWKDNWIPGPPPKPAKPLERIVIANPEMKVDDLFITGTTQWNEDKMKQLMNLEDILENQKPKTKPEKCLRRN